MDLYTTAGLLATFQMHPFKNYGAYKLGAMEAKYLSKNNEAIRAPGNNSGEYYCPMHCEGDKVYDKPGNCPVCGMNLEKLPSVSIKKVQYTCPMHPEIIRDAPGSCPICGMDLVPMQPVEEDENKTYKDLLKKFKIAVLFTGTVDGKKVALGNKKLMEETNSTISKNLTKRVVKEQKAGKTVSYISVDGVAVGYVTITDKIKETSKAAIQTLLQNNIAVIMLTGDNASTAKAVADEINLTEFKAEHLPADKLNEIKRLQAEGKTVAMAGDGINDAPALAQADVGIAMGTGTDMAIESAGITLVKGDLQGIVKARKLSKEVMKNIRQNSFFAFIYNVLGVPLVAGLLYPFFGLLLSPMIAAAAMSVSSVSVIANSLQLRNIKL